MSWARHSDRPNAFWVQFVPGVYGDIWRTHQDPIGRLRWVWVWMVTKDGVEQARGWAWSPYGARAVCSQFVGAAPEPVPTLAPFRARKRVASREYKAARRLEGVTNPPRVQSF